MSLEAIRAAVVVLAGLIAAVAILRRRQLGRAVAVFFDAPSHPLNLAVFRVAVFALLLAEATRDGGAHWFSQLPAALRVAPPGLSGLLPHIPLEPPLALLAQAGFTAACAFAMLGLFTRITAAVAVVLGVYVLGVPQLFGKLNHYHHLLWFAAVLAASPCGDALSLDRLRRRRRTGGIEWRAALVGDGVRAVRYGLPLRVCWVLIGLLYFFPGIWKLLAAGDAWILGDNLRYLLQEKWLELGGFLPSIRLDRYPIAYRLLGLWTILFELGFVFLLFGRRTRWLAIAAGLAFHLGSYALMRIDFLHLVICYVGFVDFGGLADRLGSPGSADPNPLRRPRGAVAVGAIVIPAAIACGALGIDGWPFAVYPRFHYRAGPTTLSVALTVQSASGGPPRAVEAPRLVARLHSSRWVALLRRIARARGDAQAALIGGLIEMLRRDGLELAPGDRIAVDVVVLWIAPERRGRNPAARSRVGEWVVAAR